MLTDDLSKKKLFIFDKQVWNFIVILRTMFFLDLYFMNKITYLLYEILYRKNLEHQLCQLF